MAWRNMGSQQHDHDAMYTYGITWSNIITWHNGHEAMSVGQFLGNGYGNGLIGMKQ